MNTVDIGTSYEIFVTKVYQAILAIENDSSFKNITVEQNKIIKDNKGNDRQIDVFWEYENAGETYRVAVECKNHNSNIPVSVVESFATKLKRLKIDRGIIATKKGFQSGALDVADDERITLLKIREIKEEDFKGRVREIHLKIHANIPPRITSLQPSINKEWIKETYPELREGESVRLEFRYPNTEIYFEDRVSGYKQSAYELENETFASSPPGDHIWEKTFEDGYLKVPDNEYKIDIITIGYNIPKPIILESVIDFRNEFLAIMEYVTGEKKKYAVLKNGTKKDFK